MQRPGSLASGACGGGGFAGCTWVEGFAAGGFWSSSCAGRCASGAWCSLALRWRGQPRTECRMGDCGDLGCRDPLPPGVYLTSVGCLPLCDDVARGMDWTVHSARWAGSAAPGPNYERDGGTRMAGLAPFFYAWSVFLDQVPTCFLRGPLPLRGNLVYLIASRIPPGRAKGIDGSTG